jgi:hypothetical protein
MVAGYREAESIWWWCWAVNRYGFEFGDGLVRCLCCKQHGLIEWKGDGYGEGFG